MGKFDARFDVQDVSSEANAWGELLGAPQEQIAEALCASWLAMDKAITRRYGGANSFDASLDELGEVVAEGAAKIMGVPGLIAHPTMAAHIAAELLFTYCISPEEDEWESFNEVVSAATCEMGARNFLECH